MISLDSPEFPTLHPQEVAVLLAAPAAVRGFWMDDEMLEATGLTSVPLLRKIQSLGFLKSEYVAMSVGGRRRVWTFTNVLLGELLVRFADQARMPAQTAAEWLARLPRQWLAQAMDLKELVAEAMGTPFDYAEIVGSRFIVIDMAELWFEREYDDFARAEAKALKPDEDNGRSGSKSIEDVLRRVGTALVVDVSAIHLTICDRVRDERLAYNAERQRAST
jgi:hypothetical protein